MSRLEEVLNECSKEVKRMPKRICSECGGRGTKEYETYEGGWDRTFEEQPCHLCGGHKTIGGGQPSLHLWFQNEKERDKFKARILRMSGIKWEDESLTVLESKTIPKWKE